MDRWIVMDRDCFVISGTAEFVYPNKEHAQSAIKNYNMSELDGKKLEKLE